MLFDSWLSRLGFFRELAAESWCPSCRALRVASGGARARLRLRRSRGGWRLMSGSVREMSGRPARCAPVLLGGVLLGQDVTV